MNLRHEAFKWAALLVAAASVIGTVLYLEFNADATDSNAFGWCDSPVIYRDDMKVIYADIHSVRDYDKTGDLKRTARLSFFVDYVDENLPSEIWSEIDLGEMPPDSNGYKSYLTGVKSIGFVNEETKTGLVIKFGTVYAKTVNGKWDLKEEVTHTQIFPAEMYSWITPV